MTRLITVQEYADIKGLTRQAVYHQIKTGAVESQPKTKYSPVMIYYNETNEDERNRNS